MATIPLFAVPLQVADAATQTRLINAYAFQYDYQANIPDLNNPGQTIPNPVTKAQFFRQGLVNMFIQIVQAAELAQAQQAVAQPVPPVVQ